MSKLRSLTANEKMNLFLLLERGNVVTSLQKFYHQRCIISFSFEQQFYLLLPSNSMYSDPVTSFLKVLAMMIGELEFENFLYDATKIDFEPFV